MDAPNLPPELAETDATLRSLIGRSDEPVPAEHLRRIRVALANEAAQRDKVDRRDWWVIPGILGVLAVSATGPTEPAVVMLTFAVGLSWTPLLVRLINRAELAERSGT